MVKKYLEQPEQLLFRTINEKNLSFDEVFDRIIIFMQKDPLGKYRLLLGTDSQVHASGTVFATGIVIHKEGSGAWGCIKKVKFPRKFLNLHEKISTETTFTEEVAYLFTEAHKQKMIDIVLPHIYKGASFAIEGHIDIGAESRNKTRFLIREMVARVKSVGLEAKIKPDSIVASGYANRHTK